MFSYDFPEMHVCEKDDSGLFIEIISLLISEERRCTGAESEFKFWVWSVTQIYNKFIYL